MPVVDAGETWRPIATPFRRLLVLHQLLIAGPRGPVFCFQRFDVGGPEPPGATKLEGRQQTTLRREPDRSFTALKDMGDLLYVEERVDRQRVRDDAVLRADRRDRLFKERTLDLPMKRRAMGGDDALDKEF